MEVVVVYIGLIDGNDLVVNDEAFWANKMVPSHITIEIDATAFIVKCRTLI